MSGYDRKRERTHAAKPHHIFRPNFNKGIPSPASVLSHSAAHLLDNLISQFNGKNNGDFAAAPAIMGLYGWTSNGAIARAIEELIIYGFIEVTRSGGRNKCSLYGVTWLPIDECKGKLDVSETRGASNLWKPENNHKIVMRNTSAAKCVRRQIQNKIEQEN